MKDISIMGPARVGNMWVWADGTTLPVVSGGSDPTANQGVSTPPAGGQPPAGSPPPPTPPTPPAPPAAGAQPPPGTQPPPADPLKRLDEWAKSWGAKEKAEGRASVEKEIAERLGMTLDEAAKVLNAHNESEREKMTAAERKEADAKKLREEGRTALREAHALILDVLKQDALMNLGMTREQAKGAVNLVNVEAANTPEMTLALVAQKAEEVKMLYPQLFGSNGTRPPDSANRGTQPPPGGGGNTARERALQRLRSENGGRLRNDIAQEGRPPEHDYRRSSY